MARLVLIGLGVLYVGAYLASGPLLARAWLNGRLTRGSLALARAARWASIPIVALAAVGRLVTPLGAAIVVVVIVVSFFLHLRLLPFVPPLPPLPRPGPRPVGRSGWPDEDRNEPLEE